jgi:hypothetical protein
LFPELPNGFVAIKNSSIQNYSYYNLKIPENKNTGTNEDGELRNI